MTWEKKVPGHYFNGTHHICKVYGGAWAVHTEFPLPPRRREFDTLKGAKHHVKSLSFRSRLLHMQAYSSRVS